MTEKKTAVVLGASSGIGLGCARALAQAGRRVVLFARDAKKVEAAAKSIEGEAHAIAGDIASAKDLGALFDEVERRWGGCDILVCSNGGPKPGDALGLTDEDWEEAFKAHALPVFRAIRRVVPFMTKRAWGRLVVIGSTSAKQPIDNLDLSNFLRPGLAGVLKSLSRRTAGANVTAHFIAPGSILTDRSRVMIQARADKQKISFEDALKTSQASIPAGRLGTIEEIGDVVAFLASEKASYLTGNLIQVDGGLTAGLP